MSMRNLDIERDDALARADEHVRANLRISAKLGIQPPHRYDLSGIRLFNLEDDGVLECDALLEPEDYAALIRWSALQAEHLHLGSILIAFAMGMLIATAVALLVR